MDVHLLDGTYELFRHFFGVPSHVTADGHEVGAVRGVLSSVLAMIESGTTHLGVATDHVIESFRNGMWPGYKTGAGVDPLLYGQFGVLELALQAMGVTVWAMVDWEADDAMASAAKVAAADAQVDRVVICTPDKDLAQCVTGQRVIQLDRRQQRLIDEDGVRAKFGVNPASIPDYLALVGDSADGFPGINGWGPKSAAVLLSHYGRLEDIPDAPGQWEVSVRGGPKLAVTLAAHRHEAMLFKDLATLRTDPPVIDDVAALRWAGPTDVFGEVAERIDAGAIARRARSLAGR
jgi:5'-3' exonuclease